MESTRRLDDSYYSILERLSSLQSAIGSLQDLSSHTKELRATFETEAKEVQDEVRHQIETFGGFEQQKARIQSLESRLQSSKAMTEVLSERLQTARSRAQVLENQEAEVQASISCE
jgi:chromosome segregation ATPase